MPVSERWRRIARAERPVASSGRIGVFLKEALSPRRALQAVLLLSFLSAANGKKDGDSHEYTSLTDMLKGIAKGMVNENMTMAGPYTPEQTKRIIKMLKKDKSIKDWSFANLKDFTGLDNTKDDVESASILVSSIGDLYDLDLLNKVGTTVKPDIEGVDEGLTAVDKMFESKVPPPMNLESLRRYEKPPPNAPD